MPIKSHLLDFELEWKKSQQKKKRKPNNRLTSLLLTGTEKIPEGSDEENSQTKLSLRHNDAGRKIAHHYAEIKSIASENVSHIDSVIKRVEKFGDSRNCGIGAHINHISRERNEPNSIQTGNLLIEPHAYASEPTVEEMKHMPKLTLLSGKDLHLPEWNPRFLRDKSMLSSEIVTNTSPEKLTRTSTFRQEIMKYRMNSQLVNETLNKNNKHRLHTQSEPNFLPSSILRHYQQTIKEHEQLQTNASYDLTTTQANAQSSSSSQNFDHHQHHQQYSNEHNRQPSEHAVATSLVTLAEELWATLISELRLSGHAIAYKDLIEISELREPPEAIVDAIGYICVLLGLAPTWQAARGALFKEFRPFQNFLKEVEPISLPIRRIRKAVALKDEKLQNVTFSTFTHICKPMTKVMRWILAFNKIALLMIAVDDKKRQPSQQTAQSTTNDTAAANNSNISNINNNNKQSSNYQSHHRLSLTSNTSSLNGLRDDNLSLLSSANNSRTSSSRQQSSRGGERNSASRSRQLRAVYTSHLQSSSAATGSENRTFRGDTDEENEENASLVSQSATMKEILPIAENLINFFKDLAANKDLLNEHAETQHITHYAEYAAFQQQQQQQQQQQVEMENERLERLEGEEKKMKEQHEANKPAAAAAAAAAAASRVSFTSSEHNGNTSTACDSAINSNTNDSSANTTNVKSLKIALTYKRDSDYSSDDNDDDEENYFNDDKDIVPATFSSNNKHNSYSHSCNKEVKVPSTAGGQGMSDNKPSSRQESAGERAKSARPKTTSSSGNSNSKPQSASRSKSGKPPKPNSGLHAYIKGAKKSITTAKLLANSSKAPFDAKSQTESEAADSDKEGAIVAQSYSSSAAVALGIDDEEEDLLALLSGSSTAAAVISTTTDVISADDNDVSSDVVPSPNGADGGVSPTNRSNGPNKGVSFSELNTTTSPPPTNNPAGIAKSMTISTSDQDLLAMVSPKVSSNKTLSSTSPTASHGSVSGHSAGKASTAGGASVNSSNSKKSPTGTAKSKPTVVASGGGSAAVKAAKKKRPVSTGDNSAAGGSGDAAADEETTVAAIDTSESESPTVVNVSSCKSKPPKSHGSQHTKNSRKQQSKNVQILSLAERLIATKRPLLVGPALVSSPMPAPYESESDGGDSLSSQPVTATATATVQKQQTEITEPKVTLVRPTSGRHPLIVLTRPGSAKPTSTNSTVQTATIIEVGSPAKAQAQAPVSVTASEPTKKISPTEQLRRDAAAAKAAPKHKPVTLESQNGDLTKFKAAIATKKPTVSIPTGLRGRTISPARPAVTSSAPSSTGNTSVGSAQSESTSTAMTNKSRSNSAAATASTKPATKPGGVASKTVTPSASSLDIASLLDELDSVSIVSKASAVGKSNIVSKGIKEIKPSPKNTAASPDGEATVASTTQAALVEAAGQSCEVASVALVQTETTPETDPRPIIDVAEPILIATVTEEPPAVVSQEVAPPANSDPPAEGQPAKPTEDDGQEDDYADEGYEEENFEAEEKEEAVEMVQITVEPNLPKVPQSTEPQQQASEGEAPDVPLGSTAATAVSDSNSELVSCVELQVASVPADSMTESGAKVAVDASLVVVESEPLESTSSQQPVIEATTPTLQESAPYMATTVAEETAESRETETATAPQPAAVEAAAPAAEAAEAQQETNTVIKAASTDEYLDESYEDEFEPELEQEAEAAAGTEIASTASTEAVFAPEPNDGTGTVAMATETAKTSGTDIKSEAEGARETKADLSGELTDNCSTPAVESLLSETPTIDAVGTVIDVASSTKGSAQSPSIADVEQRLETAPQVLSLALPEAQQQSSSAQSDSAVDTALRRDSNLSVSLNMDLDAMLSPVSQSGDSVHLDTNTANRGHNNNNNNNNNFSVPNTGTGHKSVGLAQLHVAGSSKSIDSMELTTPWPSVQQSQTLSNAIPTKVSGSSNSSGNKDNTTTTTVADLSHAQAQLDLNLSMSGFHPTQLSTVNSENQLTATSSPQKPSQSQQQPTETQPIEPQTQPQPIQPSVQVLSKQPHIMSQTALEVADLKHQSSAYEESLANIPNESYDYDYETDNVFESEPSSPVKVSSMDHTVVVSSAGTATHGDKDEDKNTLVQESSATDNSNTLLNLAFADNDTDAGGIKQGVSIDQDVTQSIPAVVHPKDNEAETSITQQSDNAPTDPAVSQQAPVLEPASQAAITSDVLEKEDSDLFDLGDSFKMSSKDLLSGKIEPKTGFESETSVVETVPADTAAVEEAVTSNRLENTAGSVPPPESVLPVIETAVKGAAREPNPHLATAPAASVPTAILEKEDSDLFDLRASFEMSSKDLLSKLPTEDVGATAAAAEKGTSSAVTSEETISESEKTGVTPYTDIAGTTTVKELNSITAEPHGDTPTGSSTAVPESTPIMVVEPSNTVATAAVAAEDDNYDADFDFFDEEEGGK